MCAHVWSQDSLRYLILRGKIRRASWQTTSSRRRRHECKQRQTARRWYSVTRRAGCPSRVRVEVLGTAMRGASPRGDIYQRNRTRGCFPSAPVLHRNIRLLAAVAFPRSPPTPAPALGSDEHLIDVPRSADPMRLPSKRSDHDRARRTSRFSDGHYANRRNGALAYSWDGCCLRARDAWDGDRRRGRGSRLA